MSSTLCMRKTPKHDSDEVHFHLPVKRWFARKFYDHDGTLGGGCITFGPEQIAWIEELLTAMDESDRDRASLALVLEWLQGGDTVDMWFEV